MTPKYKYVQTGGKTSGGCAVNSWQTTTIYFRVAVYFAFLGRDKGQYKLYLEDRWFFFFFGTVHLCNIMSSSPVKGKH